MEKIGWIGIGKMGNPMAGRLMDAGYELYVCDNNKAQTGSIVNAGAKFVETPAKLAAIADIIFSIIPNSEILKEIVLGKDGLLEGIGPNSVFIDMSTVDPGSSAECNAAIETKGAKFIRATVTGSVEYAANGTLGGLSSGDKSAYERVLPMLNILTNRQYYLGGNEEARYMKIIINMMLGANMQAMAESLVMGEAVGLDWNTMVDALCDSAAACPSVKFKRDLFKSRDFSPMSTAAVMDKDMRLAMDIAREKKLATPLAAISYQLYQSMYRTERADLDYAAILLLNEDLNGIKN